jgi:hypothetical protein
MPQATVVAPPVPAPPQQVVVPQGAQQASVTPDGEYHIGDLLTQQEYTSSKAQSTRDNELCPDCDSPNYMRSKESPNSMKQCFNCGFNPRFAHSTAGASAIGQKNVAPPRPARVQALTQSNYNPQTIVGRVA